MAIFPILDTQVSLIAPSTPAQVPSVNNLLFITTETPNNNDEFRTYLKASDVATDYSSDSETYDLALSVFADAKTPYMGRGTFSIAPLQEDETVDEAITRLSEKLLIGTCFTNKAMTSQEFATVREVVQGQFFFNHYAQNPNDAAGFVTDIKLASQSYTRVLTYLDDLLTAKKAVARRSAFECSVNYNGVNTAITMNAKVLTGIAPTDVLTNTQRLAFENAGADVYINQVGVPRYRTSNKNGDETSVLRDMHQLSKDLQYGVSNALAATDTKIKQTQSGLNFITDTIMTGILQRYITNGVLADGKRWNGEVASPIDATKLQKGILANGFYIYATPMIEQSPEDERNGVAPAIYVFAKNARAIKDVMITIKYE